MKIKNTHFCASQSEGSLQKPSISQIRDSIELPKLDHRELEEILVTILYA